MKKAFTLVEIVVVLLIIWILFWALWYLSWSYVYKLNVENDIQTIQHTFFRTQTMSLSQPVYKGKTLRYVWVKIEPEKSYLVLVWSTWDINNYFPIWIKNTSYLNYSTGFTVNSWSNSDFYAWTGVFLYKSYSVWAIFQTNGKVFSWDKIVDLYWKDKAGKKFCFTMNLLSGRLFKKKCK